MGRKRFVAPEFFKHGELFDAERESGLPLRLAFAGLWGQADRRGFFSWKPRELKVDVLPYDAVDFAEVLAWLDARGFVQCYEVEGKLLGAIPSFERWQSFHRNEKPSDLPNPTTGRRVISMFDEETYTHLLLKPSVRPEPSPSVAVAVTAFSAVTVASTTGAVGSSHPKADKQPTETSNGVRKTGIQALTPAEHRQLDAKFGGERQPAPVKAEPSVYAQQETELRAAALPHEALALDALLRDHRNPDALILELYSFATGMKVCRGESTGRNADVTDVMRAVAEMAANGAEWSVRLFRGYLRRIADQKPEPATAEARTAARLASEIRRHTPAEPTRGERNDAGAIVAVPIVLEAEETEEQIAARRKASAEAIAQFRQQFRQYNPTPSPDAIEPPADFPNEDAA